MSEKPGRTTVVNVISTSYSGSTWVNLLLGSHSRMFSVGEADALIRDECVPCTLHGPDCPVWSGFDPEPHSELYLKMGRLAGGRMLVVNNARYTLPMQTHDLIHPRFLFLVRDGRAVVHSDLGKHAGTTTWRASRSWARGVARKWRMVQQFDPSDTLMVHYEMLRDDTRGQLETVCDWLHVPFEPAMLEYWKHPHHFIGGNVGALSYAARGQGLDRLYCRTPMPDKLVVAPLDAQQMQFDGRGGQSTWNLQRYQQQAPDQFRDERWKRELTDWQLRVFALAAGRTNRRFGYPPSLDRQSEPTAGPSCPG